MTAFLAISESVHGLVHVLVVLNQRLHRLVSREAHFHDLLDIRLLVLQLRHFVFIVRIALAVVNIRLVVGTSDQVILCVRRLASDAADATEEAALASHRVRRRLLLDGLRLLLRDPRILVALLLQQRGLVAVQHGRLAAAATVAVVAAQRGRLANQIIGICVDSGGRSGRRVRIAVHVPLRRILHRRRRRLLVEGASAVRLVETSLGLRGVRGGIRSGRTILSLGHAVLRLQRRLLVETLLRLVLVHRLRHWSRGWLARRVAVAKGVQQSLIVRVAVIHQSLNDTIVFGSPSGEHVHSVVFILLAHQLGRLGVQVGWHSASPTGRHSRRGDIDVVGRGGSRGAVETAVSTDHFSCLLPRITSVGVTRDLSFLKSQRSKS
mmetsp:Transcript_1949/g.3228  ORF Transcript_1949/g.3228 Transcript_1949/m.3228 type:complete len:379 (+) Transcript_1949:215-1351(+)